MKLYSRATSDRASKAQGGNREIVIDLLIDPIARKEVGRVVMRCEPYGEDEKYTIHYYPITTNTGKGGRTLLHEEIISKGKQQKDELCNCGSNPGFHKKQTNCR